MFGTTRVSRYRKGKTKKVKTNLDLLEQEIVNGSGTRHNTIILIKYNAQLRYSATTPGLQVITHWWGQCQSRKHMHQTVSLTDLTRTLTMANYATKNTVKIYTALRCAILEILGPKPHWQSPCQSRSMHVGTCHRSDGNSDNVKVGLICNKSQ